MKKFLTLFVALTLLSSTAPAFAETINVNFENPPYTIGSINNQDGWSSLGAVGSGCALYDHKVSPSSGVAGFGSQSLRMSNAVTSGCFGDHTFSKSLANEAGETSAQNNGLSGGTRQKYFVSEWDFASTTPLAEQPGLAVTTSADRGDGARMSWIQMADSPTGLVVNFYDYQKSVGDFVFTSVATGLSRTVSHKIKFTMEFVDGPANDIVKVYVDGVLRHTGTSWEDYFRDQEVNPTRTVDSILFRTGGTAVPATLNNGFLIDNLSIFSGSVPDTTAPSVPVNGLPNGTYLNTNNFDFTWDSSTDNVGTITYEFQSSLNPTHVAGVLSVNVWHSPTPLLSPMIHSSGAPDGKWYWQVRAKDTAGNYSNWSQIWDVTLDTIVPAAPTLTSPSNDSTVTTHDFMFNWENVSDASPVTYEWQSSYTDTFASILASHTGLTLSEVYSPGTPDNTYFWRVRARDAAGNISPWSTVWKVTVDTSVDPVLTRPTNKDQCKDNGWMIFTDPKFKNQGSCVSFLMANEKAGKQQ